MKRKLDIVTIFLFTFLAVRGVPALAIEGAEIAVYSGPGSWEDGVIAFESFLDWKGISHERVGPYEVNTYVLKDYYSAIYFPGGDAYYYKTAVNHNGILHIRDLVDSGGGYIGMCAGAYFASDSIKWEGSKYDYPLNLFDGMASGAIDVIAPWPEYVMTTINMNTDNPINQYESESEVTLYYGGPVFRPHSGVIVDTVATWAEYGDSSAMINFSYGNGRVLLCGPHPEIEEDSDRDNTTFADELDDEGSEWNFLWAAVDWVLNRPVSQPDSFNLAGKMKYYAGDRSVSDGTVELTHDTGQATSTTDENGDYLFGKVQTGTVRLLPAKQNDRRDAITGSDALLVLQYLAFLASLNPDQQVAADVTEDGSVTGSDAQAILRYLAFYSDNVGSTGKWRFDPADSSFVLKMDANVDFRSFLLGDANGDWGKNQSVVKK